MSLIPKIKVGLGTGNKEKHNLSFDCSTTSNIGSIQPTMAREMAPKSTFKVKVSSLVRLASMPLPTFGRMSLRHYHAFVPYVDLYQPFDALMSGQHYRGSNAQAFIPTNVPWFQMKDLMSCFVEYSDISICPIDDLDRPLTITTTNVDWAGNVYIVGTEEGQYPTMADAIQAAQAADVARLQTAWNSIKSGTGVFGGQNANFFYSGRGSLASDNYGGINAGDFVCYPRNSDSTLALSGDSQNVFIVPGGNTPITAEGADLITYKNSYSILMKFKAPLKRLRTIFIGLGYQFSPYNEEHYSALKLLAYYKAWFAYFRPNREMSFVDTWCYNLIKRASEVNGPNLCNGLGNTEPWKMFIDELMKSCYYYLPADYFSMSVIKPQQVNQDSEFILNSGAYGDATIVSDAQGLGSTNGDVSVRDRSNQPQIQLGSSTGAQSPLTIKLALRMLTWANKNTVIGRSVREYLKVHFGITDVSAVDSDIVYKIGSSRTNITISDVMSTAENEQGYLGEYGGKGIGYGDSEEFDYTADKFGVWLTLSVVVPESGYYQGYLKENKHLNRYQFFNPEFDAMGYQVLERGEVMDDYNCDSASWNPRTEFYRSRAFGFVPRYSEYKVGRNIVNGDLSLAGMANSMAGYTLDRRFSGGMIQATGITLNGNREYAKRQVVAPSFRPYVVYDNFRRIDPSDHIGQYNRIFNVTANDVDHFIIHNIFEVTGYLPMKSLSQSFDTVSKEDNGSVDVVHS